MALYREGKLAMVLDVANEAAALYDSGDAVADRTRTTIVPAGPHGTRHAGLYAPPYAIPVRSRVKAAAWEVAKFLTDPEQMLDDAIQSGGVEVARRSLLDDSRFIDRFRPDLIETVRATRPIARGERPITRNSFQLGDIIAEEQSKALAGEQSAPEAVRAAQVRAERLGKAW
jgi:ABC-type glycerol-3-phosphate transport system substrate-binding protein